MAAPATWGVQDFGALRQPEQAREQLDVAIAALAREDALLEIEGVGMKELRPFVFLAVRARDLRRVDELVDRWFLGARERVDHRCESPAKAPLTLEVALDPLQVATGRLREVGDALLEQSGDLLERKAELPQGDDPIEAPDIGLRVEAEAALAAPGGPQQPKLVVVA